MTGSFLNQDPILGIGSADKGEALNVFISFLFLGRKEEKKEVTSHSDRVMQYPAGDVSRTVCVWGGGEGLTVHQ